MAAKMWKKSKSNNSYCARFSDQLVLLRGINEPHRCYHELRKKNKHLQNNIWFISKAQTIYAVIILNRFIVKYSWIAFWLIFVNKLQDKKKHTKWLINNWLLIFILFYCFDRIEHHFSVQWNRKRKKGFPTKIVSSTARVNEHLIIEKHFNI